ncbi:MAG: hypothetical protein CVV41_04545 [Candidatus Riflebacteria bacterium HGW-Riflebacteria-1]|jgi:phosphatidate phosphatase APP1|nr:MAG: hypothetical protein CVV41_04545 [Candidatus Riflebacteria bacterium HGW-Riflebacteria-1]
MKKLLLIFVLVFQVSGLWAIDLLDLRVFPLFDSQSVAFEGVIVNNSYKSEGTGLRAKLSGLRSKWLNSGKVVVESDGYKVKANINDGEFSGTIKVSSLASFTLRVYHDEKQLHSEGFSFPGNADFIVVSDIDDTILVTEVTSRLKMAYNSMFKDVDKRQTVNGTPELYREIGSGATGIGNPHFVYLSSSPAFLSRSLKAFLVRNNFPPGTLILKKSLTSGDHEGHKTGWLKKVMGRYAGKPLLLFGDSGEKDPFIYRSFVENKENPSLVKGIIIHEITSRSEKIESLREFRDFLLKKFKIPFIYWSKISELKQSMRDDGLLK